MADGKAHNLTSSFGLFTKSKDLVMKNLPVFGALLAVPFIFSLISEFAATENTRTNVGLGAYNFSGAMVGAGLVLTILIVVLMVVTTIMLAGLSIETAEGKKPTLSELWPYVSKYGLRYIGLSFAVGFMIIIGLIALIVPGLIMIRRYFLAPYVMIDQDLSIGEAMKESARISKPHSGYIWGIIGVSILLTLPSAIPVLGWIVTFVLSGLYTVAPALRYKELKAAEGKASAA